MDQDNELEGKIIKDFQEHFWGFMIVGPFILALLIMLYLGVFAIFVKVAAYTQVTLGISWDVFMQKIGIQVAAIPLSGGIGVLGGIIGWHYARGRDGRKT